MAWHGYSECFEGVLAIRRGEVAFGIELTRTGIDMRRAPRKRWHLVLLLSILADVLVTAAAANEASEVIEEALTLAENTGVQWLQPELLRLKGDALALLGFKASAEECLRQAVILAQSHGSLAWQLRAGVSLARLHRAEGNLDLAREALGPVYDNSPRATPHSNSDRPLPS